ncbi:MAG TPA: IS1182 family transposase [Candidatus Eisenbacteria bacterium]|nr:IS1182 family transposase [Candidatus Eisenbacteria bacterium]
MGFIEGDARTQGTLFPVTLEELIPEDHVCRVLDAFVDRLDMQKLGFQRAEAAETGRPGYDPRDLLKLYLYGYLQQIRSSRRLESECHRNLELMWLLRRLCPDHKSIAEFRRMHRQAVTDAGAELVTFARSVGLIRGEWIAIDGSKFRAASSIHSVHERVALERYLESLELADREDEPSVENSAVAAALEKLRRHAEPEVGFMKTAQGMLPAYNVQAAVDAEHGLIVAHQVSDEPSDNRSLLPMAEAAQHALGDPPATIHVVADAGYSNGEQAAACENKGILPHVPAKRGVNTRGDGTLFDRTAFQYQEQSNTMRCPAGHTLRSDGRNKLAIVYLARPEVCGACALKPQCTTSSRRTVHRHVHEEALQRMQQRATATAMQLRRCTVEHPFAILKYIILGHPRFLLRGLEGTRCEMSLATMAYNLKRMFNLMGGAALRTALVTI